MEFGIFKEKLFDKAKEFGFSEFELYYTTGENFSVQMFKHEIDKYTVSNTVGVCFRGIYNAKIGYAYSEVIDEEAIDILINNAKNNAEVIENNEQEVIFGEIQQYENLNEFSEELDSISADEKIELAKKLESITYDYDKRVVRVMCGVSTAKSSKRIVNSKGIDLEFKNNRVYATLSPVIEIDGKANNTYSYDISKNIIDLDIEKLSNEAVDEVVNSFGGETVDSGKYTVIFKNKAVASLLSTFNSVFNAENAQKGLSLLNGKEGEIIAAEKVTIIDNPLLEGGMSTTPFDDEGVATYSKNVVENGKLNTLLHNLKTSRKSESSSTGNGFKSSFSSPVGVAPSNFYLNAGEKTFDELLGCLSSGLIITEMQGMHSGAKPITGEFSLSAKGFLVEESKVIRAVDQITISGNFYDLLKNVIEVGNDLKFNIGGLSTFGSPSVIVKDIAVAGK